MGFLILAGGVVLALVAIPSVSDQHPPSATPLIVILTNPAHTSDAPLNAPTQVTAEAVGNQPIARLDLWVDGALAESRPARAGSVSFKAFWSWLPAVEGRHSLFVEGADAAGRVVRSNVVWINATHQADLTVTLPSAQGDTLESLSKKFGVPLDRVTSQNPNLGGNTPLPPGQPVNLPLPPPGPPGPSAPPASPPLPPPGPAQPAPSGPPDKFEFWFTGILQPAPTSPPPAPELAASWEGCNVRFYVTDKAADEGGFFIYRSDISAPGWTRIATLDAYKGTQPFAYVDPGLYGEFYYYIAAFNKAGESPSGVVSLSNYSPQCLTSQWQGLSLTNGKLTTSQPVDKIYCYLSVDYGPWSRIPASPEAFIEPTNGAFDMSQYLSNLVSPSPPGGVTLILECWGWQGGTLYYLGKVEQTIGPGPVDLLGETFALQGEIEAVPVENMGQPSKFINAPSGFARTGDKQSCAAHAPPGSGELAIIQCQMAFGSKMNALIWSWSPGVSCWPNKPCDLSKVVQEPDGYRIYDIINQLVLDVKGGKTTYAVVPVPAPSWIPAIPTPFPPCYTVRAYKGVQLSADSNLYCWNTVLEGIKTVKIPASSLLARNAWRDETSSSGGIETCGKGSSFPDPPPDRIRVGYRHLGESGCLNWENDVYRGAVWFDLSQVKGMVYNATLEYDAFNGYFQPGNEEAPTTMSCASELLLGTEAWMGKDFGDAEYWIPGVHYLSFDWGAFSAYTPMHYSRNVTSAVESWRYKPGSNFGFVLRHTEENTEDNTTDNTYGCTTDYGNFVLTVMYYP